MGGVGGGRKLGNHPLPPLGRMAGTKRERPSQRLQGAGGYTESNLVGPWERGSLRAFTAPTPRDTHTSLFPLRPLPEQLSFTRPKTPSPAGSEAAQPQVRSLPGSQRRISSEPEARVASTAPPAPSPLTHSPHPPRPAAFPAIAPPDFGAQKAGGETRERRARVPGIEGHPKDRGREGQGFQSPPCWPALCSGRSAPV